MFRKLITAALGLIVCVQSSSAFAGSSFFPHHHHHHHHGSLIIRPVQPVIQPQFIVVRKLTPYGWMYVKQPVGFYRF